MTFILFLSPTINLLIKFCGS